MCCIKWPVDRIINPVVLCLIQWEKVGIFVLKSSAEAMISPWATWPTILRICLVWQRQWLFKKTIKKSFFCFVLVFIPKWKEKWRNRFKKMDLPNIPTLYYSSCLVKIKVIRFYSYKYLFQILFRPKADCTFDNYLE